MIPCGADGPGDDCESKACGGSVRVFVTRPDKITELGTAGQQTKGLGAYEAYSFNRALQPASVTKPRYAHYHLIHVPLCVPQNLYEILMTYKLQALQA